ncbi:MAG: hypothetical protein J6Z46_12305 [Lachnospiraceae bacterium]|nr:hypothetical protein [Lachnospiraceae bacterium]
MKKLLALLLASVLSIACLAACGEEKAPEPTPAPTATTAAATSTPTAVPTEDPSKDTSGLEAAKDYLYAMYKDTNGSATTGDFERVGVVKVSGKSYNITWTVDVNSVVTVGAMDASSKMVTIAVDSKTPNPVDYKLTATLEDEFGNKTSTSFNYSVPAYSMLSWADYVAAEKGETVVVSGVVTGIISTSKDATGNSIYFQDNDGAYYAYGTSSAADPISLGIKEGMTIEVSGARDTYSGTYEIANYSVEILDSSIKKIDPANYTDLFLNAATLKDEALTAKQSLLVYLEGVEVLGVSATDATYYMFQLGDKQSYVRLSSSSCPLTKAEQETFKANVEEHKGYIADVCGILTLYDGAFYITPLTPDAFYNFKLAEKTDAEKVAYEVENLGIPAKVTSDAVVNVHTAGSTYTDVAVAYTVEGENAVYDEAAGTITITQTDKDAVVTVNYTATCNAETQTGTVEIAVEAKASDLCEAAVIEKAFALAEGEAMSGTQVLRGEITAIVTEYSEQYGNITVNIKAGENEIQCFRLIGGQDLKVGDVITVTGNIKNYKGTVEFDAKCTYSKDLTVEQAKQLIVVEKAFALAEGEAMTGKQVLSGEITAIPTEYSEQYDNVTVNIKVGENEIQCFRLIGGKDLKVGDVITVTGNIKNYKGTVEFDSKCTYVPGEQLAAAKDLLVAEKAYALAEGEAMSYKEEVTGEITEIVTEYSEQYGNITVNIKVGEYIIQCFRLIGGQDLKVGDIITVTGLLKNYKGTVEFDSKCTYVK